MAGWCVRGRESVNHDHCGQAGNELSVAVSTVATCCPDDAAGHGCRHRVLHPGPWTLQSEPTLDWMPVRTMRLAVAADSVYTIITLHHTTKTHPGLDAGAHDAAGGGRRERVHGVRRQQAQRVAGGGGGVGQELQEGAVVAVPHAVVQPRAAVAQRRQGVASSVPLLFSG
jgi:hypothetical protein